MFNTLFQSVFNPNTFRKEATKSITSMSFTLGDILSGNYLVHLPKGLILTLVFSIIQKVKMMTLLELKLLH
jgi:hypothetical protein